MILAGIDIGGTKTAVVLSDEQGRILASARHATDLNDPHASMDQSVRLLRGLLSEQKISPKEIRAIGISAAGPMCSRRGVILETQKMPGWANVPVRDRFAEEFSCPAYMENDANAAGWAEFLFGGHRGKDLIYLTMSTGIGAGIVVNGTLLTGQTDLAGEVGHICLVPDGIPCLCGRRGCWQAYCGGKPLADRLRAEITGRQISTAILSEAGNDPAMISMKSICAAVRKKDPYAAEKWDEFIERMAQGVGTLIQCFNPQAVVLGTIAIADGDLFIPQMAERLSKYAWPSAYREICPIDPSCLKNIGELSAVAAGLYGLSLNVEPKPK